MPDLLTDFRDYLVGQSLVRRPREATPAGKPPLWVAPKVGLPAPGEGKNATEIDNSAVLGAYRTGGIPARPFESSLRQPVIEVRFRTVNEAVAEDHYLALRDALIDRRDWFMSTRKVIDCEEWHELQPLGSDSQGFTFSWAVIVQLYAV